MAAKRITAPETDPTPEAVEPDTPSPATAPPPDKWDPIPPVVQHFPNGGGARVTRARQADDATARRHVAAGEMFVASFQQSTRKQMLALSEAAAVRACVDALAK